MIKSNCDMHIHTNCSDGELSPVELINFAYTLGVKFFSVTDHDNVDFYLNNEGINLIKQYKMKYISGCEFICRVGPHPIEILGYGIDVEKAKKYLDKYGVPEEKLQEIRKKYSKKIFKKYGFDITFPNVKRDPVDVIYDSLNSNDVLRKMLLNENPNVLNSSSTLLRQGLNNPKSLMFINPKKHYPSYKKIINLIQKKFQGVAILAHPYHYGKIMNLILEKVKKHNIDGIECYHYTVNSKEKCNFLIEFAKQNKLLISGGSDFHNINDIEKMRENNMIKIPQKIFNDIESKIKRKQKNF